MKRAYFLLLVIFFQSISAAFAYERVFIQLNSDTLTISQPLEIRGIVSDTTGTPTSRYLYVEILRHSTLVNRVKLKAKSYSISNSSFSTIMTLPKSLAQGNYTIRAYTLAQVGAPVEALYHTNVFIRKRVSTHSAELISSNSGNGINRKAYLESKLQQAGKIWKAMENSSFEEGEREYFQTLSFTIETTRRKLPSEFSVGITSSENLFAQFNFLSFNPSAGATITDTLSGICLNATGKVFTLVGYEFKDGEKFTVNVSGHKLIWPAEIQGKFAATHDYYPTAASDSLGGEMVQDIGNKKHKGFNVILVGDETDTLDAITVSANDQSHLFVPTRPIGPYTTVFDRHQVRLRSDMRKHDDMDLLHYIIGQYPGFMMVNSPTGIGYALVTTRGGSIRVLKSSGNGSDPIYSAANETVALYIDGFQTDWTEATHLKVRDVQNMYVLRGNEAALFSARAVIALELRRYDARDIRRGDLQPKSITITPLGICE